MNKFTKAVYLLIALLLFIVSFFGCTKEDIQNQAQKIIGNGGQGGNSFEFEGVVTDVQPNEQNTHHFGETVAVEMVTGNVEFTVNKMTVFDSFDEVNFSFTDRPVENGWVLKDGKLNPDYIFVLVDVNVKKTTEGEVKGEATLVNTLRLNYTNDDGQILPVGDMEYLYFEETDNAKHSSLPNEYLGIYLDVGCSVDCQVGWFVPKSDVNDTNKLFFSLGTNPEKAQYVYPQ